MNGTLADIGVSGELARHDGPHRGEAIRDIPRSCHCRWTWDGISGHWLVHIRVDGCRWHR